MSELKNVNDSELDMLPLTVISYTAQTLLS